MTNGVFHIDVFALFLQFFKFTDYGIHIIVTQLIIFLSGELDGCSINRVWFCFFGLRIL